MNLVEHCCNLLKRNDLESFKGVARLDPKLQINRTIVILQVLHFIREQFRLLDEYLAESLAEERRIEESAGLVCSEREFIEMYTIMERRHHFPLSPALHAVSKIHATTHRDMGMCLVHLQHPDIQKSRTAREIIRHPRGEALSAERARAWFREIEAAEA